MRFTTILASRIINNAILPLDSEDRANVLIIDDCRNYILADKNIDLRWMSGGCGNTCSVYRDKDCRAI